MPPFSPALSGDMDGNFIGLTIAAEVVSSTANNTTVYSLWSTTEGDAMTATLDPIAISSDATLEVELQHKNVDQTDSQATTEGTKISVTSTTVTSQRYTGLKQQFRYKVTLKKNTTTTDGLVYATFRMLAAAWEYN